MQYFAKKIFIVLFVACSSQIMAGSTSFDSLLKNGDEAFEKKDYAQAKKSYEQLVKNERFVSESVLYRLVFISNKAGSTRDELLYSAMLYRHYPNKMSREKLDVLGKGHFFTSPKVWLYINMKRWYDEIYLTFWVLVLLPSVLAFFLWMRRNQFYKYPVVVALIFSFVMLGFIFLVNNVNKPMSYVALGTEVFYTDPSYAAQKFKKKVIENELLNVEGELGPWLKLTRDTDTLFLAKKKGPFLF